MVVRGRDKISPHTEDIHYSTLVGGPGPPSRYAMHERLSWHFQQVQQVYVFFAATFAVKDMALHLRE